MPIIVGQDGLKRVQQSVARAACSTSKLFPRPSADHAQRLPVVHVEDDGPGTCLKRNTLVFGRESLRHASLDMGAPGKIQIK